VLCFTKSDRLNSPMTPLPIIDAGSELLFARELSRRSAFSHQQLETIEENIRLVEARAQDETLYLAVLGEFSSGKSTFINALLRQRLLKSAPQATTAAATSIRYATDLALKVHFMDGSIVGGSEQDCANLRTKLLSFMAEAKECPKLQDLLLLATVEPSVTRHVAQVEVGIPAATLRSGISVIDTPGIGAGADSAKQHQAVTERVTADTADAAVILIPADGAMTRTLIDFLSEKTRRFLHRCVVVITKMDHVQESERADVCEFVEAKLAQVMGKKPLILQSAAATMLPVKEIPVSLQESWSYWRASFSAMEKALHQELARNRAVIIAEHLTALLHSLLTGLQEAITTRRASLVQERSTLERNSVADLERVLASLFARSRTEIEQEVQACKLRIHDDAGAFEDQALQTAASILDAADKDTLAKAVDEDIPAAVNVHQQNFDRACENHWKSLRSTCERVERQFTEQFESHYRDLRALGVKIEVSRFASVSDSLAKGHFSSTGGHLKASEAARARIGALIGRFTGCIAAPAAGTVGAFFGLLAGCGLSHGDPGGGIVGLLMGGLAGFVTPILAGGFLGAKVGSKMGDLAKLREEARALLMPEIKNHMQARVASRLQDFENARATALKLLEESVRAHTREYSGVVNRMLEEHSRKMESLAQQEKQAQIDSTELLARTQRLDETRAHLLALGA
jgi:GTPase Era involved in 16S rRNA processing